MQSGWQLSLVYWPYLPMHPQHLLLLWGALQNAAYEAVVHFAFSSLVLCSLQQPTGTQSEVVRAI